MAKRNVSADINQPMTVTVTGAGGAGGVGGGTLPGTLTGITGNTVTGDRHYHAVRLEHSALLGMTASDHHNPVTISNTGLSLSGQDVSLQLATVSGLEISAGLMLADSIAGAGLTIANKVLAVGAGGGISVGADTVGIDLATNSGLQLVGSPAKLLLRTPSTLDATTANTVTDVLGHTHAVMAYSDLATYPGHLAKADGVGDSTWHRIDLTDRLRTQLIDSAPETGLTIAPALDLNLSPGGTARVRATNGVRLQSDNYVSQLTGWGISYSGGGDFRYLYADELHAKAFIADLEQALAGGQIICKSVAPLAADFTIPAPGASADLYVEEFKGFDAMRVFVDGDIVRVRQFQRQEATTYTYNSNTTIPAYTAKWHSGTVVVADGVTLTVGGLLGIQVHYALSITNTWGTVAYHSRDAENKVQRYTFTRSTGANAGYGAEGSLVGAGTLVLDYGTSGNGFYEVNSIDGSMAENSPYAQVVTWTGHPATGLALRTRYGNLRGIFNVPGEFGMYAGDGVTDADRFLRISNAAIEGHNLPIKMYDGGSVTMALEPTAPSFAMGAPLPSSFMSGIGVWMGKDGGTYKFRVGNPSGHRITWDGTTLTVRGDILVESQEYAWDQIGEKPDGAYRLGTATQGGNPGAAGLWLTAYDMGYWNGSSWPVYIRNNGQFYFGADANNYLKWDGSTFEVKGRVVITGGTNYAGSSSVGGSANDTAAVNGVAAATVSGGAARANTGLTSAGNVARLIRGSDLGAGSGAAVGLNLTSTYMGYYDGSQFRTYMDSSGNFLFSKSGGASLLWDASAGKLQGRDSSNAVQWETDATTGAIKAATGRIILDKDYLTIASAGASNNYVRWTNSDVPSSCYCFANYQDAAPDSSEYGVLNLGWHFEAGASSSQSGISCYVNEVDVIMQSNGAWRTPLEVNYFYIRVNDIPIRVGVGTADPTVSVENGMLYYRSDTHKLRLRANGAWVNLN